MRGADDVCIHNFAVRCLARGGAAFLADLGERCAAVPTLKGSGVIRQRDTDIFELVQYVAG